MPVSACGTLTSFGCTFIKRVRIPDPGQRHGANGHLRVDCESVILLCPAEQTLRYLNCPGHQPAE